MRKFITIKTNFPATHRWPECKIPEVSFLRKEHRHVFYVTMTKEVSHSNRDIEFISLKMKVEDYIDRVLKNENLGSRSCEDIAELLLLQFDCDYVAVFEDDENGAEIYKD